MKNNNKTPLTHALKQYYANHQLSEQQLEGMIGQDRESAHNKVKPSFWQRPSAQLYSTLTAIAFAAMMAVMITTPIIKSNDLTGQAANEIAYNHNKQVVMEIRSEKLATVSKYLSQLGFSLITSSYLPNSEWELLGGRYCSIQGKLAAQLKMRKRSGETVYTFYQALLPDSMKILSPYESYVDGIKVTLWQEKGLLLGLAGQANN